MGVCLCQETTRQRTTRQHKTCGHVLMSTHCKKAYGCLFMSRPYMSTHYTSTQNVCMCVYVNTLQESMWMSVYVNSLHVSTLQTKVWMFVCVNTLPSPKALCMSAVCCSTLHPTLYHLVSPCITLTSTHNHTNTHSPRTQSQHFTANSPFLLQSTSV